MKRSRGLARTTIALLLAAIWMVGNLAQPLSARGLERGVGRIGDPGGARGVDNRVHGRAHGRAEFWDEAEDEHQKKVVLGIIGGVVIGALIAKPPKNSQKTQAQGQEYYYSEGNYYKPQGDQYEVVAAPRGATVNKLPEGAKKMELGDETYFVVGETFYAPTQTGSEILFEVVESPFG